MNFERVIVEYKQISLILLSIVYITKYTEHSYQYYTVIDAGIVFESILYYVVDVSIQDMLKGILQLKGGLQIRDLFQYKITYNSI